MNNKDSYWSLTRLWRSGLVASVAFGSLFSLTAQAQEATDDENLEEIEGFVVTGSLIRRTDLEGPAPVLSISRDDIETSGFQQISDLIRSLPMNNGLSEADATASFAADGAYVNLRGIGPGGTLVLVNGRRLAPYGAADFNGRSFVDLNSFPTAAIDRVDVLKTGASAVYGSDALGGAINIILRKDFEGLELNAFYGNSTREGDFGTTSVSATLGTSSAKGSIIVIANFLKREPLFMRERDFSAVGNFGDPVDFTASLEADGYLDFTKTSIGQGKGGGFSSFFLSSAAYPGRFDTVASNPAKGETYFGGYLFAGDGSDGDLAAWEYANYNDFITHISGAERKGLVAMSNYQVTENVEVFMEGNYQTNYAESFFAPAPSFGDLTIAADNPYNPTNPANTAFYRPEIFTRVGLDPADYPDGAKLTMTARVSDAGTRDFETTSDFIRFVAGATIELKDINWTIEPSFMYVESRLEDATRNLLVIDNFQTYLNNTETSSTSQDPTTWAINPFVTGPGEYDNELLYNEYVKTTDTRLSSSQLDLYELRATGPVLALPGGDLMAAAGFEWRTESLEDRPSLASQQGQLIGSGGTSSQGRREAWALYGEVIAPVLDNVEVQVAARFEDYDDFGDTGVKPQFGVKVDLSENLSLRAAFADNFKAPSLAQAYAGVQRGFIARLDQIRFPITGDAFDSASQQKETRTGGNPTLQPEESKSYSVGLIFSGSDKLEGLEIAIDGWQIDAESLITTISETSILNDEFAAYSADPAAFLALSPTQRLNEYQVLREPNENFQGTTIPGRILYINSVYVNLDSLTVNGVDFDIRYTWRTDNLGTFQFGTFWTLFARYEQNDSGFNEVGTFRLPKWRGNAQVTWSYGDWDITTLAYYVHSYEDDNAWGPGEDMVDHYLTFDLRVGYSGLWDTEFTIGIDNIFDEDPPFYRGDSAGYDPAFSDPIGTFIWASVKKSF